MGWLCDGDFDCGTEMLVVDSITSVSASDSPLNGRIDNSDENLELCHHSNICPPNYFRCSNLINCIPMKFVCNGATDCPDGSDEFSFCGK